MPSHLVRVAALIALAACGPAVPAPAYSGAGRGDILWDTWGVPHVYARSDPDAAYGLGWAQMQSHGDMLLELYGETRGRAAEYWGEDHFPLDQWVHTMSIPERAAEWYAAQEPAERALVDAFAAGINAYAKAHPDRISPRVRVVVPVSGLDVVAHQQRVILFTALASPLDTMAATQRWAPPASNAWAIAPSRSASHHALLLANPHLPWSGTPYTMFEFQLTAPDLDVYGATFVGFPVVAIGMNSELAWTHTWNKVDGADLFEVPLTDTGYLLDGKPRAFEERRATLRVKQPNGALRDEPLIVRSTVHGPVVGARSDRVLALRVAGLDSPHLFSQYMQMAHARDLHDFEAAVSRLQVPLFNVIYADRAGHILQVYNGRVPRRSRGDYAFWNGIVPGDSSALIWKDTLPYAELPRMLDPPTGWLQNTNDPPWSMTLPHPLDPARFPPYMAPLEIDQFRTQRSLELIAANDHLSLDDIVAAIFSARIELADRLLDDLLPVARDGGALAQQSARVLAAWDRTADASSRGGVLFAAWAAKYLGEETFASKGFAIPWSRDKPLMTPDGIADPARAVAALEEAAKEVTAAYGALDVPWGSAYRIQLAGVDVPASGAWDDLGSLYGAWYTRQPDGRFALDAGDTFVLVVELGPTIRAKAALGYGNASQDGSPHRTDQLPLLDKKQLREVWHTRAAVEQHVERREAF